MQSHNAMPPPVSTRTERGITENSSAIGDRTNDGGGPSLDHSPIAPAESVTDASANPGRGDDALQLARLLADALKGSVAELRRDDEARMSQFTTTFQQEVSAFRQDEEKRLARLEKTITNWKPPKLKNDPITNFWTVYKKVADEHDNDLVSKYVGDLDTSLLFAGLFSAITSSFIIQIIPSLQPNPSDLTNVLLLRILQQNTSFDGTDPLAPVTSIPTSAVRAQSILFASFSITLIVAFIAVLGKQWILYYTRVTTWGNIADRGKERQDKLVGLQRWGLHFIMESLPVMLQFALLLFGVALSVYLWDLEVSAAEVSLAATCAGAAFYGFIAAAATIWRDCPFQTPLSLLLPKVLPWTREFTAISRLWLRRRAVALLPRIRQAQGWGWLMKPLQRVSGLTATPNPAGGDPVNNDPGITLSNPALWRLQPLFYPPIPKDIAASAGFWMLENSTDFSASTAVAAVFSEFQWPAHQRSKTALIRFRDVYAECFRAPEFKKATRLKALQTAAAYYVFYHSQLIWSASKSFEVNVDKIPSDLPSDLFLHKHTEEWGGDDLFEYLLHVEERSESVTSARFLSYIAPYWFCGDSDSAIRFRPSRLQTLYELIQVLEDSEALVPATLTDCVLCVGAAMDFPLHPEDLIRLDKSDHFQPTFKLVVEHLHAIAVAGGRRRRHARTALEIILTLVDKTTLPLVDAAWINDLLGEAAEGKMSDEAFILFLKLRAATKEEEPTLGQDGDETTTNREVGLDHLGEAVTSDTPTPEYTLFSTISRNVQTCSERKKGWEDEAVYGGLIAIRDIPRLGSCLPELTFLKTLSEAMGKSDAAVNSDAAEKAGTPEKSGADENNKPFRVRKAAYDVIRVAQDGWLRSPVLREELMRLDFPRQLYSVLIETNRRNHQLSFLNMMVILSEDRYWHSYLREATDIWLPFRHEGTYQVIRILASVGEIPFPEGYDPNSSLDKFLVQVLEDEWVRVPGRPAMDLSADLLEPLAEVTTQLKELLFNENDRRAVLAVVEQVIPSLERRLDGGYEGPGKDIRGIVEGLIEVLRGPTRTTSRRSTYR